MYKVGDRVRIVEHHTNAMNRLMDKWLGKVMTIRRVDDSKINLYKMEEDRGGVRRIWLGLGRRNDCRIGRNHHHRNRPQ